MHVSSPKGAPLDASGNGCPSLKQSCIHMTTGLRAGGRSALACIPTAAILFTTDASPAQEAKPPQLIQEAFVGDLAFTQDRGEVQIGSLLRVHGSGANRTAGVAL